MSISLTIGSGSPIDLLNLSDLESNLDTVLKTGDEFNPFLGGKISAVPNNLSSGVLNCATGERTWQLSAAVMAGGASGIHSIVNLVTNFADVTADKVKQYANG